MRSEEEEKRIRAMLPESYWKQAEAGDRCEQFFRVIFWSALLLILVFLGLIALGGLISMAINLPTT